MEKLVLNGANLDPWGVKLGVQIPIAARYAAASLLLWTGPRMRRRWELLDLMTCQPHIPRGALAGLTAPALVIAGTRDMIRGSHTRAIAQSLPNARLAIIPGDHFIVRTNTKEFLRHTEAFLLQTPEVP